MQKLPVSGLMPAKPRPESQFRGPSRHSPTPVGSFRPHRRPNGEILHAPSVRRRAKSPDTDPEPCIVPNSAAGPLVLHPTRFVPGPGNGRMAVRRIFHPAGRRGGRYGSSPSPYAYARTWYDGRLRLPLHPGRGHGRLGAGAGGVALVQELDTGPGDFLYVLRAHPRSARLPPASSTGHSNPSPSTGPPRLHGPSLTAPARPPTLPDVPSH